MDRKIVHPCIVSECEVWRRKKNTVCSSKWPIINNLSEFIYLLHNMDCIGNWHYELQSKEMVKNPDRGEFCVIHLQKEYCANCRSVRSHLHAVNAIFVVVVTNWIIVYSRRIKRRDDDKKHNIINLFRWVGQKSATPFNLSTTLALHSVCVFFGVASRHRRHMFNQFGKINIGSRKA